MEPGTSLSVTLNYLQPHRRWTVEKPYTLFVDVSRIEGASSTNILKEAVEEVQVRDVRSHKLDLSLDENGFEVITLNPEFSAQSFEDPRWIEEIYYRSVCQFVKERLGAKEVRCYEHKLRYRHPGFGDPQLGGHADYDPPVPQVHADMTPAYGLQLFAEKWPEALDSDRLQVLNLWRPLVDTVVEWPLALCDYKSVDKEKDLRATDQIKRLKGSKESDNMFVVIESFVSHYNLQHVWYYLKDQKFNEGWLLKLFDSQEEAASSILHTSIDIGESTIARRSCEVRLLVRY